MRPFDLKKTIRSDQEAAHQAWSMRDFAADSLKRMRLAFKAFPYAINGFIDHRSPLQGGGLSLIWWEEDESFAAFDLGGFLTIIEPDELLDVLKEEAKERGRLRHLITGVNPFEKANLRPKPYQPEVKERLSISLSDLNLKL